MKLLIISAGGYPSNNDLYKSMFVHKRVKEYVNLKNDCCVFVPKGLTNENADYSFEGIYVKIGELKELIKIKSEFKPNVVLIHFLNKTVIKFLIFHDGVIPIIFWVHGYGAISIFRYLFEFKLTKIFLLEFYVNIKNLIMFNFLNRKQIKKNIHYVFVSNWMKKVAATDTLSLFKSFRIIPNPIDENLFNYKLKDAEQRKKILLIRSFHNKKYANDIAIKGIIELSKSKIFPELEFAIYGYGIHFELLTSKIRPLMNVKIYNKFLTHYEISNLHKEFGIFLCPTRIDAQGVSMCEAMQSGLVPITSNSTAIPEFVTNNVDGFLTNNSSEIADKIIYLFANPDKFLQMSNFASQNILQKSGSNKVIKSELDFINSLI